MAVEIHKVGIFLNQFILRKIMNIKTSIIGVSGYTGLELVKLLLTHRHFTLSSLYASESHRDIASLHPSLKSVINLPIKDKKQRKIAQECELAFLALPHQKQWSMQNSIRKISKLLIYQQIIV